MQCGGGQHGKWDSEVKRIRRNWRGSCNIAQYFALEKDVGPTLTKEGEETLSKGYSK